MTLSHGCRQTAVHQTRRRKIHARCCGGADGAERTPGSRRRGAGIEDRLAVKTVGQLIAAAHLRQQTLMARIAQREQGPGEQARLAGAQLLSLFRVKRKR